MPAARALTIDAAVTRLWTVKPMSWSGPRTAVALLACVPLVVSTGCDRMRRGEPQPHTEPQPTADGLAARGPSDTPVDRDAIVVVQLHFDVLRVELPADTVHHSDKTWNHVAEPSGDPARTALLRRNGLRVGTASADAWPALRAVFEASQATVIRAPHVARLGAPLALDLGPVDAGTSVFLLTEDHRLVGTSFESGSKYLRIDYAVSTDDGGFTTLRLTPEVNRVSPTKRWQEANGDLRRVADYDGRVFHELSFAVDVPVGEFLVIGPDTEATPLSIGRRFLTRDLDGRKHETILCITPQPFLTDDLKR